MFALITFALVILPPLPLVTRLPKLALPVAFNVPAILTPVPVTTIVVLPTAVKLMLPFAAGMLILLLPLDTPAVVIPVRYTPLPVKKLADTLLPKLALPAVMLPVTLKLVNVPTEVMFGCAAVVTVPAVVALVAELAVP